MTVVLADVVVANSLVGIGTLLTGVAAVIGLIGVRRNTKPRNGKTLAQTLEVVEDRSSDLAEAVRSNAHHLVQLRKQARAGFVATERRAAATDRHVAKLQAQLDAHLEQVRAAVAGATTPATPPPSPDGPGRAPIAP